MCAARARKVAIVQAACSVVGTLVAVYVAVNVPDRVVKTYIGVLVLGAVLSVPLAAITVKKVSLRQMRGAIGVAVTALGMLSLSKAIV